MALGSLSDNLKMLVQWGEELKDDSLPVDKLNSSKKCARSQFLVALPGVKMPEDYLLSAERFVPVKGGLKKGSRRKTLLRAASKWIEGALCRGLE